MVGDMNRGEVGAASLSPNTDITGCKSLKLFACIPMVNSACKLALFSE
jgi:hypothetical protein